MIPRKNLKKASLSPMKSDKQSKYEPPTQNRSTTGYKGFKQLRDCSIKPSKISGNAYFGAKGVSNLTADSLKPLKQIQVLNSKQYMLNRQINETDQHLINTQEKMVYNQLAIEGKPLTKSFYEYSTSYYKPQNLVTKPRLSRP